MTEAAQRTDSGGCHEAQALSATSADIPGKTVELLAALAEPIARR